MPCHPLIVHFVDEQPFETTPWANEEWIIIFIVWGVVLTICTIILGIWLVYESQRSASSGPDYDTRSHMTGSLPHNGLVLAPMTQIPNGNSMGHGARYNGQTFAQLQYPDYPHEDIYD